MGMDVHGNRPKNEKGEYFRNNVWWWRPLWNYCLEVAPAVAGKVEHGHTNDGDGLGERDSLKLAAILREKIENGECKKYADDYAAQLNAIPMENCDCCNGTGVRPGGKEQFGEAWFKNMNGCNGCKGKGKVKPWASNYPFSEENESARQG